MTRRLGKTWTETKAQFAELVVVWTSTELAEKTKLMRCWRRSAVIGVRENMPGWTSNAIASDGAWRGAPESWLGRTKLVWEWVRVTLFSSSASKLWQRPLINSLTIGLPCGLKYDYYLSLSRFLVRHCLDHTHKFVNIKKHHIECFDTCMKY